MEDICAGASFSIKLQASGVFLRILRNFLEHLFTEHLWTTASVLGSVIIQSSDISFIFLLYCHFLMFFYNIIY